ncbi:hypothetical protein TNCV_3043521 [Trichonephila clavipes]|nr:hypothetical protein TNCV_3043521 [Trichonephila clavipes]
MVDGHLETENLLVHVLKMKLDCPILPREFSLSGRMVTYHASAPQVQGSILGLLKVDLAFYPFNGSINFAWGLKIGVSLQTDHLIGMSAHAPQRQMVTYTEMGTVGLGPHGLLRPRV